MGLCQGARDGEWGPGIGRGAERGLQGQGTRPCQDTPITSGSPSPASAAPSRPVNQGATRSPAGGVARGHSPGHRWALHCRYSSWGPWQADPPKKGPEQTRSRRCVPPPHVTLQPPHCAQACHFPSTAENARYGDIGPRTRGSRSRSPGGWRQGRGDTENREGRKHGDRDTGRTTHAEPWRPGGGSE